MENEIKKENKFKILWQLFITFLKIGAFTFGGGYAMITLLEREVVQNKKWITAEDMQKIIIVAETTPGVIAVNASTFIGFKRAGILGSVVATLGAILPSIIIITLIYYIFDIFKDNKWVLAAFKGIHCAVVVLIFNAMFKLLKPMKKTWLTISISIIACAVALFTSFNTIFIILIGGVFGVLLFTVFKPLYEKRKLAKANVLPQSEKREEENK